MHLNFAIITGTALGFQIDGAVDFFHPKPLGYIRSFCHLKVLLEWLDPYLQKLMVRLHHAHHSNAAQCSILLLNVQKVALVGSFDFSSS